MKELQSDIFIAPSMSYLKLYLQKQNLTLNQNVVSICVYFTILQ
jgi:hypothetical protein